MLRVAQRHARTACRALVLLAGTCALAAPTARAGSLPLVGDCDGDGTVTISELVTAVSVALGDAPLSRCALADANGDGAVSIDELIRAVNNALNGATATATPTITREMSPSPTPGPGVYDFSPVGGQPCGETSLAFQIGFGQQSPVSRTVTDFCLSATAFDVAAITCSSPSAGFVIDAVSIQLECQLDDPADPRGQVRVTAHAAGDAFAEGDSFSCRVPVFIGTTGGSYPVTFRVAATTTSGLNLGAGSGDIQVFGLPSSDRFSGQCCSDDSQCSSGFCRGGDPSNYKSCCDSDCPPQGVCNQSNTFNGTCCASAGTICDQP